MVVDCPSLKPLPLHLDRFPGATVVKGFPKTHHIEAFLDGLDVVLSCETFYNNDFPAIAERMGVKTVLQYNFEFLEHLRRPDLPKPTLFAAPSMWRYDEVPFENKCFLPVPIAIDRFPDRVPNITAKTFLHIIGRPAIHDRNGTADLLDALQHVRSNITVVIKCQEPRYVQGLLLSRRVPRNVELRIDADDTVNYWDNYSVGDVLVMPRRFGGLCLPANEALGAGMPVIMPDIEPNNAWLPQDWLVPASKQGQFQAKTTIDLFTADHEALAAKIDQFAQDETFFGESANRTASLAKELSWDNLKSEYQRVFTEL